MDAPVGRGTGSAAIATGPGDGLRTRRGVLILGGLLGGAAALTAACGNITNATAPAGSGTAAGASGSATAVTVGTSSPATGSASAAPASGGATPGAFLYLTIVDPTETGKKDWPSYIPANFSVPANTAVQVQITCFDTGGATVPAGYEKVQGTVGNTMTVWSSVTGDATSASAGAPTTALDPKGVCHTLSVPDLGLNVPIPGGSTVRFTFQSGAAGSHKWQCMASCGTGDTGWEGPMADSGWMSGTLTVQA